MHLLEHKSPALNMIRAARVSPVFLAKKTLVGRARDKGDQIFFRDSLKT